MARPIKFFSFEPHIETLTLSSERDLACHSQAAPVVRPCEALIKPRQHPYLCNNDLRMRRGSDTAALFRARSVELFPAMARCCDSFFAKCKERGCSSLSPNALSARYKLLNFLLGSARLVRCVRRHKESDGV